MNIDKTTFVPVEVRTNQVLLKEKATGQLVWLPLIQEIREMFNIPHLQAAESISNLEHVEADDNSEATTSSAVTDTKLWSSDRTLYLIFLIEESMEEFENTVKKTVWLKFATNCTNHFKITVSAKQVESKWKALKRTYKSILLHNKTSGKQRRRWEFFDAIHKFMHKMPEIEAPATCSSSQGLTVIRGTEDNTETNTDEGTETAETPKAFSSSFTKKRQHRESEASKRHKDKMQRWDRFNNLFEKFIEKD